MHFEMTKKWKKRVFYSFRASKNFWCSSSLQFSLILEIVYGFLAFRDCAVESDPELFATDEILEDDSLPGFVSIEFQLLTSQSAKKQSQDGGNRKLCFNGHLKFKKSER